MELHRANLAGLYFMHGILTGTAAMDGIDPGLVQRRLIDFTANIDIALRRDDVAEVNSLWQELQDLRETIAALEAPPRPVLQTVDSLIAAIEPAHRHWLEAKGVRCEY